MNKELINSRFAKTLSTYDENAIIQQRMAVRLLEFLKENKSIVITISTTDGHNVKKRIHILSLSEDKFEKLNK